ncbi:MAG: hypothetical protein R2729_32390 [Bryobacteraceae bacterium]
MKAACLLPMVLSCAAVAAIRVDVYQAPPWTAAIEYDIVVPPGADPGGLALRFDGATGLNADGDLLVARRDGSVLRHSAPVTYQVRNGVRRFVWSRFRLRPDGATGFDIGPYDRTSDLIIDPVVTFADVQRGSRTLTADRNTGVAYVKTPEALLKVDPNGAILSSTVPLNGAIPQFDVITLDQAGHLYFATRGICPAGVPSAGVAPGGDIVVGKLNPDLLTSAYLFCLRPGPASIANSAVVDSAGSLYVTGATTSDIFPATAVFGSAASGAAHMFAFKVVPAGDGLAYSIVTGNDTAGKAIALDNAGNAWVAGVTGPAFEPRQAFQPQFEGGTTDGFLLKIVPNGTNIPFATFLGGTQATGVAVDAAGNPVVILENSSLPVVGPFSTPNAAPPGSNADAYVAKFTADAQQILLGSYLNGANGGSTALGMAGSDVYVTGMTNTFENPLPEVNGIPLPPSFKAPFAVRLDSQFQRVLATRLPGARADRPRQIFPTRLGFIAAVDLPANASSVTFVSEQADLAVNLLRAPATQQRVEVANFGPENATGVRLSALFLNNTITATSVPCTVLSFGGRSTMECSLGTLFKNGAVTVAVTLANPSAGSFQVSSSLIDPNPGNNRP